MREVRAAVCREFGAPLSIETLHLRAPEAGEIEVTLEACAICHSDISYIDGGWGGQLPAVYGHEAAGRVTGIGPGVTGLALGDFVVVTLIRACGSCASCGSGAPVRCETPGTAATLQDASGAAVLPAMNCGAFAEAVVVDQSQVVKVSNISAQAAALLACGVITGVGSVVNAAELRAGQDVVVIGAGGVGLNAIQGARIAGARRIIAVDTTEDKLAIAKSFGATDGVLATGKKPWVAAMRSMGRGADAVIVTVGAIPAFESAPRYLAPGGRVIMVGMPHSGQTTEYEPVILAALGQGMQGSKMGDVVIKRDIPWMADLYAQGRLQLDELISKSWSLSEINEAIADTKTGAAKRNVITFGSPS
ncbi:zinc-binding dehydrogenase [Primorskyibacter sp. S187A]|uniref:zinc-binding dehydrogenase n=1 Tax=Primorskyibacter sp. S187A TaxID=3415130 RepID=UPI003C7B6A7D